MGQQLSGEAYCQATMQKLLADLNTTDSRVSESHVTSWSGDGSGGEALSVDFTWREWARVSKYLERVLPCEEQKRILGYVLLDQTGLRHCRDDTEESQVANGNDSGWTVHINYGDEGSRNPILYRDFVKLHFQLDGVPAPHPATTTSMLEGAGEGSSQAALDDIIVSRLADVVKRRCGRIGINLLVTGAKHHTATPQSCVVVSGTVDVRSVLRNAKGLEVRSKLNPAKAEDQELSDQLLRSAAGLRDRIDGAAAAAGAVAASTTASPTGVRYFPMRLSYLEATNRVTLVYAKEARTAESRTIAASLGQ